jgi:hypothetical protein
MGFHEDDRIRRKNSIHNEAYEAYRTFKGFGRSDAEIITECTALIKCGIRNEVYSAVLKIAGGDLDDQGR